MANAPNAESNEARLVEIARTHVRKFGHARTTVVGVAAEAGMTHANVYRYFPSKTALLDEVVASGLRPLEARLRDAVEGADPAYDKLERMLLAVHRDYRGKLDDDPELFEEPLTEKEERVLELLSQGLSNKQIAEATAKSWANTRAAPGSLVADNLKSIGDMYSIAGFE